MNKVILTKSKDVVLDVIGKYNDPIIVYSNKSKIVPANIGGYELEEYKRPDTFTSIPHNSTIIIIGISDMIRPSNRCDEIFENLYNSAKYIHKVVIDDKPFVDELWRCWYLFAAANPDTFRYPHSYALESAYNNYLDGIGNNPLEFKDIAIEVADWTTITYNRYFDFDMKFVIHKTSAYVKNEYEELKKKVFDDWRSIPSSIKTLHQFAQSVLQEHNLSRNLNHIYDIERDTTFHITDLNVDKFLMEEYKRIYNDTNNLIKEIKDEKILR